jgi:hypothetical protein
MSEEIEEQKYKDNSDEKMIENYSEENSIRIEINEISKDNKNSSCSSFNINYYLQNNYGDELEQPLNFFVPEKKKSAIFQRKHFIDQKGFYKKKYYSTA